MLLTLGQLNRIVKTATEEYFGDFGRITLSSSYKGGCMMTLNIGEYDDIHINYTDKEIHIWEYNYNAPNTDLLICDKDGCRLLDYSDHKTLSDLINRWVKAINDEIIKG